MKFPVQRVGSEKHHFFGYYNKSNWDRSGRYLLGQQVDWRDALLTPDLEAEVGFFDLEAPSEFHVVGKTCAWNWQMGSQLQWLEGMPGRQIIYNVRTEDGSTRYPYFGSMIADIDAKTFRAMPMPIYVASPSSEWALSVNYRRLYLTHQTIGYSSSGPQESFEKHPSDDGIYRMDLKTGTSRLILSYDDMRNFYPRDSMRKAIHWTSHIEVNPSSSRILFLHRWTERVEDETCFLHRLITMNPDGSDLRLLECSDHPLPQLAEGFDPNAVGTFDYEKSEYQISHPLWRNDRQIIVWGPHAGEIHYHLYTDADQGPVEVVGRGVLTENGHMTFSPVNQRWLLSDTYPEDVTYERTLFLFDMETGIRHDLGKFTADRKLSKENRCDLHPRWRRDGKKICIDSNHEHDREMYLIDVSALV